MSHGKTITLVIFGILCMGTHCGPHPAEREGAVSEVAQTTHDSYFALSNQTGLEVKVSSFYLADCVVDGKDYSHLDLIAIDDTTHGLHNTPTRLRPGDVIPFERSRFRHSCTLNTIALGDRLVNVLIQPHAVGVFEVGLADDGAVTVSGAGARVVTDVHREGVDEVAMCSDMPLHRSIWYEPTNGTWDVDGVESTRDGCLNVGFSGQKSELPFQWTWSYCGPKDAWLFSRGDTLTFSSRRGALSITAQDGRWIEFREYHDDNGQEFVPLDKTCLQFERGCVEVRRLANVHLPGSPSTIEQGTWLETTREVDGRTQDVRTFVGEASETLASNCTRGGVRRVFQTITPIASELPPPKEEPLDASPAIDPKVCASECTTRYAKTDERREAKCHYRCKMSVCNARCAGESKRDYLGGMEGISRFDMCFKKCGEEF